MDCCPHICADFYLSITISPVSIAARGFISGSEKGLSVRFPRFLQVRLDKSIQQANDPAFLYGIYRNQPGISNSLGGNDELEDELGDPDLSDAGDSESDTSL